jgi:hypothetical protein
MNNEKWTIKCEDCGVIKYYPTYDRYYEANRLKRTRCRSCANKKRWNDMTERSKYDKYIKNGNKFGLLTIISDKVEPGCRVRCKCKCGKIISRRVYRLLSGKFLGCKKCLVENLSLNWKGMGKVPKMAFIRIKNRAQKKEKEFDITLEYISELFDKQNGKCALSGVDLIFYEDGKPKQTASLDRIDSSKGYINGNVQWIHKDINFMKQDYSEEHFKNLCRLITNYDKSRNRK